MHVTHLESALDGTRYDADQLQTTHRGRPLWVRYDLDAIGAQVDPSTFANRSPTMWRYHELLPAPTDDAIVSLREGLSPVVPCPDLGAQFGLDDLWIKDEAQMPTGTFKSRGLSSRPKRAPRSGHGTTGERPSPSDTTASRVGAGSNSR